MTLEELAKLDFRNPDCIQIMTKHWDVLIDIAKAAKDLTNTFNLTTRIEGKLLMDSSGEYRLINQIDILEPLKTALKKLEEME